jgi:hypothetical protein
LFEKWLDRLVFLANPSPSFSINLALRAKLRTWKSIEIQDSVKCESKMDSFVRNPHPTIWYFLWGII